MLSDPRSAGAEAVGVVEELGPGTSGRLSKGQRVVAADWGQVTYQEYVAVEEKNLVLLWLLHLLVISAHASSMCLEDFHLRSSLCSCAGKCLHSCCHVVGSGA